MERSKRLDTNIVVRQRLVNKTWVISIANTQESWWGYVKRKYYGDRK